MAEKPHLTVATLIERDNKFLCVRETRDGIQVINQPAGHVEAGESIAAAAVRETKVETGYNVRLLNIIGIYTYRATGNGITYCRVCFSADIIDRDDNACLDADIDDYHWYSYPQLKDRQHMLRSELVLRCIDDFREGRSYPLDLLREPV